MDPSIEAVRNLVSEQDTVACRSGTELMEILKPGNCKEKKKLNLKSCLDRASDDLLSLRYSLSYVQAMFKLGTSRYIPK
jgi:hypothetical protein